MNRQQKRALRAKFHKLVFRTPFEAREFMAANGVKEFLRGGIYLGITDANDQETADILFTYFGARIMQGTRPVKKSPPPNCPRGAHFVEVVDTGTKLEELEIGKQ